MKLYVICTVLLGLLILAYAEKTEKEAALAARQLLNSTIHAELVTIVSNTEKPDLNGFPFGSLEYITPDCTSNNGDVIMYLADISVEGEDVQRDGERVSVTIRDLTYYRDTDGPGVMDRARLSLLGTIAPIADDQVKDVESCFFKIHPDAAYWKYAHVFRMWRLTPKEIYWVGGFGSRHYIGWISVDLYQTATSAALVVKQQRKRRV
ncbi:hypothetical protein SmJEL517_g06265 [Synchytrium microbalum]|uniref:CREG-like beta-barrel domain-containing protein n=1 Tax=Synchytrium microbalum TaxID=1806994 RepID=A0A507BSE8_9FUNG|nr:uncharacterized protein SmJEL517_g06265 [Synchytrium microbalum]TPX30079.1 hypothetical protein SmJEL517_g06265 [Synchytrium microbalum]